MPLSLQHGFIGKATWTANYTWLKYISLYPDHPAQICLAALVKIEKEGGRVLHMIQRQLPDSLADSCKHCQGVIVVGILTAANLPP